MQTRTMVMAPFNANPIPILRPLVLLPKYERARSLTWGVAARSFAIGFASNRRANREVPMMRRQPLPRLLSWLMRQAGQRNPKRMLVVSLLGQTLREWQPLGVGIQLASGGGTPIWGARPPIRLSSSRYGIGQREGSYCTPLGLHRIARKIGGGLPLGTVFRHRIPIGYLWQGHPKATICHRILWLEGLQEGWNRGGTVDTFHRCVYIHGFADETTLGRPQSHGCLHLSANDLIPLFDRVHEGTLVWIER